MTKWVADVRTITGQFGGRPVTADCGRATLPGDESPRRGNRGRQARLQGRYRSGPARTRICSLAAMAQRHVGLLGPLIRRQNPPRQNAQRTIGSIDWNGRTENRILLLLSSKASDLRRKQSCPLIQKPPARCTRGTGGSFFTWGYPPHSPSPFSALDLALSLQARLIGALAYAPPAPGAKNNN